MDVSQTARSDRIPVYVANTSLHRPCLELVLSPDERSRADAFVRPDDRARYVVGAALVRVLAGRALALPAALVTVDRTCGDCGRPHGRPVIEGGEWQCSVSHSGRHVVVAVGNHHPVGVDVESTSGGAGKDHLRLHRVVLAPGEAVPRSRTDFLAIWTRKEALLKLCGEGLRLSPRTIRLTGARYAPQVIEAPAILAGASVANLNLAPDAIAALAIYGRHRVVDVENVCHLLEH